MSKPAKPWKEETGVVTVNWENYRFAQHETGILYPEAHIREWSSGNELGPRFGLYVAEQHERGGWLDEDGDHNYKRIEMVRGTLDIIFGYIRVTGFIRVLDEWTYDHNNPEANHYEPQEWIQYPRNVISKLRKKGMKTG